MIDRLGQAGIHTLVAFRAQSALQAALGFLLGLLLAEPEGDFQKVALPRRRIQTADRGARLLDLLADIGFIEIPFLFPAFGQIQPIDEAMNALGGLLATATASTTDLGP